MFGKAVEEKKEMVIPVLRFTSKLKDRTTK